MSISAAVSVIIPVFNAERYVRRAVESALAQPEVAEVILAEDGSRDGSLAECRTLAASYPRVHLVRHLNGANRGAGAARNLALAHATQPLIAFLDADDYYLPGRFSVTTERLRDPRIDGVYEAIGVEFESNADRERFLNSGMRVNANDLTTVSLGILPEHLCQMLLVGGVGYFSLDGLTLRRELLLQVGNFDESLRLHQDTHLIIRLAYIGRLIGGALDRAVTMRWVHRDNRITRAAGHARRSARRKLWHSLIRWGLSQPVSTTIMSAILWRACWDSQVMPVRRQRWRWILERARWVSAELILAPLLTFRWWLHLASGGRINPLPRLPPPVRITTVLDSGGDA